MFSKKKISVILADIDDLTQINKIFTKSVGNAVLSKTFEIFKEYSLENEAYIGRCGDDTFFMILIGMGSTKAKKIGNELRLSIKNYNWDTIIKQLRVTSSLGISRLKANEDIRDSITRASLGMIRAKETGKNLVLDGPKFLAPQEKFEVVKRYTGFS